MSASSTSEQKQPLTFREVMSKAAASAARGGTAGAVAMGANVACLMWMRTTVRKYISMWLMPCGVLKFGAERRILCFRKENRVCCSFVVGSMSFCACAFFGCSTSIFIDFSIVFSHWLLWSCCMNCSFVHLGELPISQWNHLPSSFACIVRRWRYSPILQGCSSCLDSRPIVAIWRYRRKHWYFDVVG